MSSLEDVKDIEIDNSNLKSSRSRLTVFLKCLQLLFRDGGENKNSTRELITNILTIYKLWTLLLLQVESKSLQRK